MNPPTSPEPPQRKRRKNPSPVEWTSPSGHALYAALVELYGREPDFHCTRTDTPDAPVLPLYGVSVYSHPSSDDVPAHWHYITYGMSEIERKSVGGNPAISGLGIELSFRLIQTRRSSSALDSPCMSSMDPNGRKCSHCQARQTVLWRHGPLGRGTLCNACGVKWKRGVLRVGAASEQLPTPPLLTMPPIASPTRQRRDELANPTTPPLADFQSPSHHITLSESATLNMDAAAGSEESQILQSNSNEFFEHRTLATHSATEVSNETSGPSIPSKEPSDIEKKSSPPSTSLAAKSDESLVLHKATLEPQQKPDYPTTQSTDPKGTSSLLTQLIQSPVTPLTNHPERVLDIQQEDARLDKDANKTIATTGLLSPSLPQDLSTLSDFVEDPPHWPVQLLMQLACCSKKALPPHYYLSSVLDGPIVAGLSLLLPGPIYTSKTTNDTNICGLLFAPDPQVTGPVETVNGSVQYIQLVGITADEYRYITQKDTVTSGIAFSQNLSSKLSKMLVTDLSRPSIVSPSMVIVQDILPQDQPPTE